MALNGSCWSLAINWSLLVVKEEASGWLDGVVVEVVDRERGKREGREKKGKEREKRKGKGKMKC